VHEQLNPKEDKSNKETIYTRNKIRNELIPYLEEEFNPNIITVLNRLSNLAKEENDFFNKQVEKQYEKIKIEEFLGNKQFEGKSTIVLDLKKFNNEEKAIEKRVILYAINQLFGNTKGIEKIHIEDIIKLCNNNIGNKFLTPNKKLRVEIKNKTIVIKRLK